jgi:membrane fusion protein (multidrug efflux system)
MYVRAVVEEGVAEHALLVPQQGVTRNLRGDAVSMIVTRDGKVEERQLDVERAVGDRWLITAGLAPGDKVIVEGKQNVRPGAQVTAVPFIPPSPTPASARPVAMVAAQ